MGDECIKIKCDNYEETVIKSGTETTTQTKESENICCYNLQKKLQEFLHTDNYMLEYKNLIKKEENIDRLKVLYSKFFQPYSVLPTQKTCKDINDKYFNIFGIIPLELIPASYIPFNYKNYDMNLDRLKKGEIFFEDDYKRVFIDYNKHPDPGNKKYISEKDLKEYLEFCLKDKLNNPKSIFNAYSIFTMTIIVCILWFFIVIMMLYVLFYYYRDIYTYILLFTTIILVLIAIIWKMIYILNID
jgi:hypothetical protein